jgi:O-6-methylguanine DNA methyltransferase
MTASEPIHDLIEIQAASLDLPGAPALADRPANPRGAPATVDRPALAIVASAAGGAVVELRLFPSAAAALAAIPTAAPRRAGSATDPDPTGPSEPGRPPASPRTLALLQEVRRQLTEYFASERRVFDLPLDPRGTDFERRTWQEVAAIPYGTTRSYAQVAEAIGRPAACRAVGRANGSNPIPLVIPCHRVIGSDGSLTGYGGGLPLKRFLLELEGVTPPPLTRDDSRQLGLPLAKPGTAAAANRRTLYGIVRP